MLKIKNSSSDMWCSSCDYRGTGQLWDEVLDKYFCPLCEEHEDFLCLKAWQEIEYFFQLNCPEGVDCEDCDLDDNKSHQDWIMKEFNKRFIGVEYKPTLPEKEFLTTSRFKMAKKFLVNDLPTTQQLSHEE